MEVGIAFLIAHLAFADSLNLIFVSSEVIDPLGRGAVCADLLCLSNSLVSGEVTFPLFL